MNLLTRLCCIQLLVLALFDPALADIRLPSIFGNHMMLQQRSKITLWGWSSPNEKITVTVAWDTTRYSAIGSSSAKWSVVIPTPPAGGPYSLTLKGHNTIILNDVMIGEVWLCSGQSNMEMSLSAIPAEDRPGVNSKVRLFTVSKATSEFPQESIDGEWRVCDQETINRFSAVGYCFGNKLQNDLGVPVGLINSSWGGTPAEVWTPHMVIDDDPVLLDANKRLKPSSGWPIAPGSVYNAMIHPIANFAIRGVIWYQGESNVSEASSYQLLFTSMIESWRKAWRTDFPFYYVQIAPFAGYGNGNAAALLREAQTKSLSCPRTGMVVISDLVDNINDIHPKLKKEVGLRLANYALAETYGITGIHYQSPMYESLRIDKDKIRISFAHAANGLISKKDVIEGFYIAGEDRKFYPASAKIDKATVIVWSKKVKKPVAVRFGFTNDAVPDLFAKDGLPVNSFRTDDWNVETQ